MSQVAVRLTADELDRLDAAVAGGAFRTRAEAIRAAIGLLDAKLREARIADSYLLAYEGAPLTGEEVAALDAAAGAASHAMS
jgi:Arc/MetJ-type ribon-helix-helix transcriptional regulator